MLNSGKPHEYRVQRYYHDDIQRPGNGRLHFKKAVLDSILPASGYAIAAKRTADARLPVLYVFFSQSLIAAGETAGAAIVTGIVEP